MRHYYVDPTSGNLIIRDTEKNDLLVVERIESVRVMTKGEIRIGDFDGNNDPGSTVEARDGSGGYLNGHFDAKAGKVKRWGKQTTAARGKAVETPKPKKRMQFLSQEAIDKIKARAAEGKSPNEIAKEFSVSYATAYKYSKAARAVRESDAPREVVQQMNNENPI